MNVAGIFLIRPPVSYMFLVPVRRMTPATARNRSAEKRRWATVCHAAAVHPMLFIAAIPITMYPTWPTLDQAMSFFMSSWKQA